MSSDILLLAGPLVLAALGTGLVRSLLLRHAVLDMPNHRSSHTVPTPRGGGMAVTPVVLLAWAAAALWLPGLPGGLWGVLAGALGLGLLSWLDDLKTLPAAPRFLAQILAAGMALAVLPGDGLIGLLPLWVEAPILLLALVWFVNLYNFMDGIDGIAGTETACLGLGLALVAGVAGLAGIAPLGLAAAGAALGFLYWNWHPARIFLGDVGSIPLGYLLGWLLLWLAVQGHLAAALILPLYYVADASLTLGKRALRGEKVWQAHREHFYQRSAKAVGSHSAVVKLILAANLGLIALAVASVLWMPWLMLGLAVLLVAGLLAWLQRLSRSA